MPSAPGRLSMITGCPSDCDIEAAMTRAMTSVAPPVPKATIARSGLVGYWACARNGAETTAARHAAARILVLFISALRLFSAHKRLITSRSGESNWNDWRRYRGETRYV